MIPVCLTSSVSTLGGGVAYAVLSLADAMGEMFPDIEVLAFEDGGEEIRKVGRAIVSTFACDGRFPVPRASGLEIWLRKKEMDLLHTHGLWTYPSQVVPRIAKMKSLPWLVSPHGMLDGWALANARWKKKLAAIWFENRHLGGASCVHALCAAEAESIRAFGLRNPVCVIPNGVELPMGLERRAEGRECRMLLFLGRLHPKKGLVNALRAWSKAGRVDCRFVIAGWDQGGHEAELKKLCDEIGLAWVSSSVAELLDGGAMMNKDGSVCFVGPAFGEMKDRLLRAADLFILPSFSEGLPMAVLEAWAYGLPVIMTDHCNLPEGFERDAAIRTGTDSESIACGLTSALAATDSSLMSMGQNGRRLVERQFTWPRVAAQMKEVYEWVLGGGNAPSCVETYQAG